MTQVLKLKAFGAMALLGAGLFFAGCKSAPELTQANALALVQASYDKAAGQPLTLAVGKAGFADGITAKYWTLTKIYPNKYWADYTLTADGKKVIKAAAKGDVIEWRPDSMTAADTYTIAMTTVAPVKLKAKDAQEISNDSSSSKSMIYSEATNFEGVPDGVQKIAHEKGNSLSTKKTATFTLVDGAWTFQSSN